MTVKPHLTLQDFDDTQTITGVHPSGMVLGTQSAGCSLRGKPRRSVHLTKEFAMVDEFTGCTKSHIPTPNGKYCRRCGINLK